MDIEKILEDHKKYVIGSGADLRDADLCGADLRHEDFSGVNLYNTTGNSKEKNTSK